MTNADEDDVGLDSLAASFGAIWETARDRSVNTAFRARYAFRWLLDVLEAGLDGDLAECGVYRGGFSYMLARAIVLAKASKRVHLFDSFVGLPEVGQKDRAWYRQGQFRETDGVKDEVERYYEDQGMSTVVRIHAGWFADTFRAIPADQRFCFVHFDGDLYSSTRQCFESIYPRLVAGGVLVLDDFFTVSSGLREAVREHLRGSGELLFAGPEEAVCLVKGRTPGPSDEPYLLDPAATDGFPVSMEAVAGDEDYFRSILEKGANRLTIPVIREQIERLSSQVSGFKTMLGYHEKVLEWSTGRTAGRGPRQACHARWDLKTEDRARALSPRAKSTLVSRMAEVSAATQFAFGVLIVPTLGGDSIKAVMGEAFQSWQLGDRGVLIAIAIRERDSRIQTGPSGRRVLGDDDAARILRESLDPHLPPGRS